MDTLMNLVSAIFRFALKLVLIAAAAVFALSLIFVALLSLVWVLLKALLTGRKPAFVTTFQRFNQARLQFKRGGFGAAGPSGVGGFGHRASAADVVDVQAHEVRNDQALPYGPSTDRH
uniref:Uncharacterized protein n=1 Tax=Curvibacter symbiont subsp. Hydra magnipapillata TaxID=667019 RepID=C9YEQ5_CURXX|nr:hypothetical protein Csp_D30610 [Curvibacter putative symbiont of Hydra magnipapillata]